MSLGLPPPSRTVNIESGRTVGYYEFGDPRGVPVFALHGTPESGAGFVFADEAARARGVRLLAPDRPGIGATDPMMAGEWTVAGSPAELAAAADALGVDSFAVLGYSGGAPFALAAAHSLGERVQSVAIVAGAGQVGVWASISDFDATDGPITRLALVAPAAARAVLAATAWTSRLAPAPAARIARIQLPRPDRAVMKRFESPRAALAPFTSAFTRGAMGVVTDYIACARAWGFDVSDITVPVRCWHGDADITVPIRHSEELVARVPGAALIHWPGGGHLAIIDHVGEVLEWLLAPSARIGRSDQTAL